MSKSPTIKSTRTIYPQIYAYVLPGYPPNEGWIKIGYTERQNVDVRIRQQTHTAGIIYSKLWSEPAKFADRDEWFLDRQLHTYLRRFKGVEQRPQSEWFYYDGMPENARADFDDFRRGKLGQAGQELEYLLRTEQEAAITSTLDFAATHPGGEFLWNAKPRFGKTLTTYDLARRMKAQKVLVVTNRPAIANSWFDDFETYIAWQTNFRFVSTADSLKERPVLTREQFNAENHARPEDDYLGCIAFISLQDLKGAIGFGGYINKLAWVKALQWDLLVIDEAHEGVDTFKTDVAFDNITRGFTLHLSGTPFKAVASGKFSQAQIYNWTYADEQNAKATWPEDSEANNPYEGLPRLNLFSYQMSQMITDEVNKGAQIDGRDVDFAFDLNEFFATGDNGKFVHEDEVKKWLDSLTRNEKYPFSTKELRAELKHTFWLLNRVASAKALEKLLGDHPVFENYEIVLAAGDGRTDEDEGVLNERSLDRVRKAIKTHDKTITLSVGQLTTGVTVPEWTGVMMLSNLKSPSLYMQAAFRAQNPWSYKVDGEGYRKQNAYVFDFAPERTLIIYDEFANNLNGKTASGGGTTLDREENIKKLLNFFPVIAEDVDGRMVELDVRDVLTIPKAIKAQEVVKRGFMSNLLFQNISNVFASPEARAILEELNPVAPGRVVPSQTNSTIGTQGVQVDGEGNATVDTTIVVSTTNAHFGEKLYGNVSAVAQAASAQPASSLAETVARAYTNETLNAAKEIAKENSVTVAQAEQVVKQNANLIAREVETVKKKSEIKQAEATIQYKREIAEAVHDIQAIAEATARYQTTQQEIEEDFKQKLADKVAEKTRELTQKATEEILQKGEEKKKSTVEDDIRARLRGFARTIPSFLMAYGEPSTTLVNFDGSINDAVFKEVTGITLDQFRTLRDTYHFFDAVVFDESVQEFLRKKAQLANYFDDSQTEDIFDYIPPQRTNQIYTPKRVVKMMIDTLEAENPDIFTNRDLTFADLHVKSGLYLAEVAKRLFVGLESVIPDRDARLKHILEHQVYGFAPSEIIYNIVRNFVFGGFAGIGDANLQHKDLTETARSRGEMGMKFDVVVGNPPYQLNDGGGMGTSATPIYQLFVGRAIELDPRYLTMVIPSRWFSGGRGLDDFREAMLNDDRITRLVDYPDASECFPGIDISGGICYFLWERDKRRDCTISTIVKGEASTMVRPLLEEGVDTFIRYNWAIPILRKVQAQKEDSLSEIVSANDPFGFDVRVQNSYRRVKPQFGLEKTDDSIALYYNGWRKSGVGFVRRTAIDKNLDWVGQHKVFISKAYGERGSFPYLGLAKPFLGEPDSCCTETYLLIGPFASKQMAENAISYIETRFFRFLVLLIKNTQNGMKKVYSLVPRQDFNEAWTDQKLYGKYGFTSDEIAFIESMVRPMDLTGNANDEILEEEDDA